MTPKQKDEAAHVMQALAARVDRVLNKDLPKRDLGFVILVFPFDGPEGARVNYVSNATRPEMLISLKEIVARFEGQSMEGGRA